MLCLMSSSHPDRSDIGGSQSHRAGKRKAADNFDSDSDDDRSEVGGRHRLAKRPASGAETASTDVESAVKWEDALGGRSWFNPSSGSSSLARGSGIEPGDIGSHDPFIREGLPLDPMGYNLFSNPMREPTLASLLGRSESVLFPPTNTMGATTGNFSNQLNPRLFPEFSSMGSTTTNIDPFRMESTLSRTNMSAMPGRDLLLARQRSPHQYNHSISNPSGVSHFAESKESSPVPIPTIASRYDQRKATSRRPSLSYQQSVTQAQDLLNRQRYTDAISAFRSANQEPRTLREILSDPTEGSMVAAAQTTPFRRQGAPMASSAALSSWASSSPLAVNPSLAELLARRRSSLSAAATTTAASANYSMMGNVSPSRRLSLPPRLFPSERSALENAMAFGSGGGHLSHHNMPMYSSSAAATAASAAELAAWPSVEMEVEALAASLVQRQLAARQSLGTSIPYDLPVSLSLPEDSQVLSELQVFIRQQIQVFRASEEDTLTHKRGRNKPITVGQVGIRCRHCAHLPIRARQVGSTYFPSSLMGIYQVAQNMAKFHLQTGVCNEIPVLIQRHLDSLVATKKASVTSGVGRHYWAESAKSIGLVDTEEAGIRFIRDL